MGWITRLWTMPRPLCHLNNRSSINTPWPSTRGDETQARGEKLKAPRAALRVILCLSIQARSLLHSVILQASLLFRSVRASPSGHPIVNAQPNKAHQQIALSLPTLLSPHVRHDITLRFSPSGTIATPYTLGHNHSASTSIISLKGNSLIDRQQPRPDHARVLAK